MLSHVKILQSCEDGGLHVSQILMPMAIMANNSFGMKLSLLPNCHRLAWPIGIHIVDTKTEVRTRHTRIRHGSCCADSLHVVSHHRTAQKAKKSRMPMDHLRWSAILYYWVFVDVSRRDKKGWLSWLQFCKRGHTLSTAFRESLYFLNLHSSTGRAWSSLLPVSKNLFGLPAPPLATAKGTQAKILPASVKNTSCVPCAQHIP